MASSSEKPPGGSAFDATYIAEIDPLDLAGSMEDSSFVGGIIAERYRVIRVIGRGGMGTVYECEHVQLHKRVALKVLAHAVRQDPEMASRFLTEARAAAQIGHPNIVDIFDLGELPTGGTFIAMELLEGDDLDRALKTTGAMPFHRARSIVSQVCRALAAAHALGIVHRDMKPANVFLARDADGTEHVKVLDFGIAHVQDGDASAVALTQTGTILGTPAFMSPEQGRGVGVDHRTDIYSVGCILYMLLTNRMVFEGPTAMSVIARHMVEAPVPPSERVPETHIPPELDAVVLRALAKDPEQRFQTMKELWMALEALNSEPESWTEATSGRFGSVRDLGDLVPPLGEPPTTMRTGALPPVVRRSFPLALSALVVMGLGFAWWWHGRPARQPGEDAVIDDVALDVSASRPDARVTIRGVTYPLPLHTRLSRSKNAEMVEVSAPSCAPSRSWVTLDRDRGLDVVLSSQTPHEPARVAVPEPPPRHANPHAGRHASASDVAPVAPVAPVPVPSVVQEQAAVAQPVAVAAPIARPKPALAAAPPVAQPMLALPSQAMQRLVHAHQSAVDSCIAEDPSASGKLGYQVVVAPDGKVSTAQLVEAQRRYPAIESCLVHALAKWTVTPAPGRPASGRVVIELD